VISEGSWISIYRLMKVTWSFIDFSTWLKIIFPNSYTEFHKVVSIEMPQAKKNIDTPHLS
jgi:hypothetical protein